jgi:haloacetate dehalogenase
MRKVPALWDRYEPYIFGHLVPDLAEIPHPAADIEVFSPQGECRTHCGYEKAAIVGHDRGARVATRFAKDYPEAIERLAVMDNIPTRIIFERMSAEIARGHWFFIFNNVPDLPEALISGREEVWLRFIFSSWCYNPELFTPEELAVYVKAYSQPGALRGAFSDYRAGREDVAQDEEDKDVLIGCNITWMSLAIVRLS